MRLNPRRAMNHKQGVVAMKNIVLRNVLSIEINRTLREVIIKIL